MEKILSWILEHKKLVIFLCIVLLIGVPVIIHILFSIPAINDFFMAKWSAGDILQYYASILGLIPTTFVSIAALKFTMYVKEEDDKKARKVIIGLKNESHVIFTWWSRLKHLKVPFFTYGPSIPEYVTVETFDMYSSNNLFDTIKLTGPRNLMSSIEILGEGKLRFDITLNDSMQAFQKIRKVWKDYCRGLLSKEEFISNTGIVVLLKLGVYSGGIVTPVRLTFYLKWDLEWEPETRHSNEIRYIIKDHTIYTSVAVFEKDYEKQWE